MSEQSDAEILSRKGRAWLGGIALLLMFALIVATTWLGSPTNSLHTSAQSWAFTIFGGILVGFGYGAVAHLLPFAKR